MYHSGCHRHRWRPMTSLTSDDKSDMYHFGYYGKRGSRLFPCRGYVEGELAIGKYDDSKNICYISYGSTVKKLTSEAEVLTIPGGLSRGGFSYKLISSDRYSDSELIRIAVPAGRVGRIPFDTERGVGYIAYTTFFEDNGVKVDSIGKVWNRAGELNVAHFPHGPAEKLVSDEEFYVMTCSKD
ncbi:unnamed protein product [Orchesella dallaii]|uniref:Uncharacterized protein n=1 Tax=Orchesella dallaii TaxID=48710 RepID=A0ABP1QTR2_9HEXA